MAHQNRRPTAALALLLVALCGCGDAGTDEPLPPSPQQRPTRPPAPPSPPYICTSIVDGHKVTVGCDGGEAGR